MKPVNKESEPLEDQKLEIVQKFYMGSSATSPHTLLPSINSEAFMFLKSIFRRKRPKGMRSEPHK